MNQALPKKAAFHHMEDGTAEDWAIIGTEALKCRATLNERIVSHLMLLDGDDGGFPVDRLTHCLQTATLAHKDGKDEEYVVCALLHDIGAAHQDRLAHAGILESGGGADHRILFALGKHYPLGLGAHRVGNHLEQAGTRVQTGRQFVPVGIQVGDLLLGNA